MVTSEAINDRLTRLEERFDAAVSKAESRFTNVWRAGMGVAAVDFALLVDAINDGFDLATLGGLLG